MVMTHDYCVFPETYDHREYSTGRMAVRAGNEPGKAAEGLFMVRPAQQIALCMAAFSVSAKIRFGDTTLEA
ncbi:hypothetical protein [Beijerinckia sp. L45]|uniref:hypothetical protein n=1 Tax=Beijerinckia sp. L45 TaxID=1641855 RepID=UPI00131BEECA|nr:hypothetical protein [Beijerinckia sp. L45]